MDTSMTGNSTEQSGQSGQPEQSGESFGAKQENVFHSLYTWSFIVILGGLLLLFVLLPKSAFSDLENRFLQAPPSFSWNKLFEGKWTQEAETYVTDHFPFRNTWVAGKSTLEQWRLQQENNGIFRGKDGYLFEKLAEPDAEKLAQYTEAVRLFAERNKQAHVTFLLAPTSIGIYEDKLPWLAQTYPQRKVHEQIMDGLGQGMTVLDSTALLMGAKDQKRPIYYKTDHHWTTYGAYLAYTSYAKQMGWTPLKEEQFDITTVSSDFLGSFHTRSLFSGVKPDRIEQYTPVEAVESTLIIMDDGKTYDSLYDSSHLAKKDQYAYFQGGVHALMEIRSVQSDRQSDQQADLDRLLVIKDSYAHSMLPFLTTHVDEIHVIDIRYYNGQISRYMEEQGIDEVLLLFNSVTFMTENSLLKLKY